MLTCGRPTKRPLDEVIEAWNKLKKPLSNDTALTEFLSTYFGQAGSELEPVPQDQLETNATFLDSVNSTTIREFLAKVIDIWPDLTRTYVGAANCTGCVDSFLEVKRTFVVAGGRFREPYYWDSYWIVLGLLRTQGAFTQIALNIIENFLDFVEQIGFVPNGARLYYENRSQPPLLTQMIKAYIAYTGNQTILERAVPILEREHSFWTNNRTVTVETGGNSYSLNVYRVENNQPRPESYREDYITANNESYYSTSGIIYPEAKPLNASEMATLYSNLASGAESGMDYTSRWLKTPLDAARDNYFPLRSLNTREIVNVDLNSILYGNEMAIADFHKQMGDTAKSDSWSKLAKWRSEAMYAVMWNETHNRYFDWNMTSHSQNVYIDNEDVVDSGETCDTIKRSPDAPEGTPKGKKLFFSISQFYPFWMGAAPDFLKNNPTKLRDVYEPVASMLELFAGGVPTTNFASGQQWDEPNVWPPLQHILVDGLLQTPATFGKDDADYVWTQELALNVSQRYVNAAFCTWRSTGGSLPGQPKLEGATSNGIIFEKYNASAINAVGGGGEYAVVEGFGWSNGVLIWIGDNFGDKLQDPNCGNITAANTSPSVSKRAPSAVELHQYDSKWIRLFKRDKQ